MPAAEIRAKYNAYRQTIDRRREVLRTPQPQPARRNPRTSAKTKYEKYFDYDLLLVIVFLMCFGLVMLYSTSAYEADADFGNDLYYFIRQALIAAAGFVVMFVVSKIDYHIYGAFAFEIYIFAMFMMALVQTPLGLEFNGARRWIRLPGNQTLQPAEIAFRRHTVDLLIIVKRLLSGPRSRYGHSIHIRLIQCDLTVERLPLIEILKITGDHAPA